MPPTPAQIQGLRVNWRGHPDLPARCVEFTLPLFRAGVEPLPLAFICENIALALPRSRTLPKVPAT